ncbi:MAG: hypothetical protein JW854_16755 [Actinobacteria bacterium]|nr:hypothetical protein [Actinomycetota bacterium]
MFDLLGKVGKIGIGCATAGMVLATAGVLAGVIIGGIAADLSIWVIVLICMVALLFDVGMAVIFYFAFKAALGPEVERRRLLETGEAAEATIMEVVDTGMTMNEIYPVVKVRLEVRPPGRPAYQAETQMIINRMDIPQVQPGLVVPVRFDPRRPQHVAVVKQAEIATVVGTGPADASTAEQMVVSADRANREVLQSGEPAQARILLAQPLGIEVNGPNPAIKFALEIYPVSKPAFKAETIAIVAQASIPKYQPGKTVFVKFDPADTTRVAIDHS